MTERLRNLGSRISATQRFWLATVGILLATFFLGSALIQTPWQERRRRMEARFSEEQQRLELLQTLRIQGNAIRRREEGLLLEGGAPALTSHLSRLAKVSEIEIESVTPQMETALPPYLKFQIEITASANAQGLVRFLHAMEHHKPLLVADEIEVGDARAAGGAPSKENTQRIRLRISGYARKEPES